MLQFSTFIQATCFNIANGEFHRPPVSPFSDVVDAELVVVVGERLTDERTLYTSMGYW